MDHKETLKISGMTCASCSARIEKVVGKLSGVSNISVNLATEKANIEYNNEKVNLEDVIQAIERIGFGAKEDKVENEITMSISGMTCASCSARIEKVIGRLHGVSSISVNLATEKARIIYDPSVVRLSEIKGKIESIGYKAVDAKKKSAVDEDKIRKEKEIKILWRKFIIAVIFCVPLLYLAMGSMIWWLHFPIPNILRPMDFPLNYALVQLALTIPIVIVGYKFYTVGYKALLSGGPNMDSLIAIGTSAAVLYSLYSLYQILNLNYTMNQIIF